MKKTYLVCCAILVFGVACQSYAQKMIAEGSILGTGTLRLHTGQETYEYPPDFSSEEKFMELGFLASGGYAVMDDLLVGAGFEVAAQSSGEGDTKSSVTHISFGPMVRYYFAEGPFVQGFYGFGSGTDKEGSNTAKYSQSNWNAVVGYSVRISDVVLFDPMVGYRSVTFKGKDFDDKQKNSGIFIQLGFTIFFVNK